MPPAHQPTLEALRLRRWAFALLGHAPSPPPRASPAGWELFLGREACAPPLLHRAGPLAPPELRNAAAADAQVILLLRAELQAVLAVAARLGIAPVILKGGATLLDGPAAVRAKDIDLLLPPAEARALAAALDAEGWRPHGGGSPNHLAERVRPEAPPVEIHTTDAAAGSHLSATAYARARPHPTLPGARLLHPDDQIRHLALHQTIEHVAYRGRLRDLFLLNGALRHATGDDPVESWGLARHQVAPVAATIAMAQSLSANASIPDRFEPIAAAWYLLESRTHRLAMSNARRLRSIWTYSFLVGGGAPGDQWRTAWGRRMDAQSNLPLVGALGATRPRLGQIVRLGARALYLPLIAASARLEAWRVRQEVAGLLRGLDEEA